MSERLARHGRVGAEEVTDLLNRIFSDLLAVADADGGWASPGSPDRRSSTGGR
jgi:hypothetical protein